MEEFTVTTDRTDTYPIQIENGLLDKIGMVLREVFGESRAVILTDANVGKLYHDQVEKSLAVARIQSVTINVSPGESAKSLETAGSLYDELVELGVRRRDVLVALGGGMITDLGGFVAATYMRGIPLVNVPTSLVAQLDAAIGGKVAVNHASAKNLIGSFYYPKGVYIDPEALLTLPRRDIRNGLAEAIKVATIHSPGLFEFIESEAQSLLDKNIRSLEEAIARAVKAKLQLIGADPFEGDPRRPLNFGHSIGHAIETVVGYRSLSHGEAISIGMATAARIALAKKTCNKTTCDRIIDVLTKVDLPTRSNIDTREIWRALNVIRLIRGGSIHFVLPVAIGKTSITAEITYDDIRTHLGG